MHQEALRSASQCDCQICSFVEASIQRWHGARSSWRRDAHECVCPICADSVLKQKYLEATRSSTHLCRALLPCGETEYPD